ncbi:DUF397 domain-containing protein [Frankia sp. Mgl5]|uniref:DUF397 domain-containing protein n=1 Tax=Frankia sp. Mgl5 TaxID=2933793 RepID=UPI00200DA60A|nr:DUF397 domain-containing protein [Frankia sp. Mgl5]MCK9931391.1 DUF397 domain-containing protein [Frankia sp. Mgl5]
MPAFPSALPAPVYWRRPSQLNSKVVDAVEVARDGHRVLIRSSLGREVRTTPGAFADFVRAAQRGEYDDLISGVR